MIQPHEFRLGNFIMHKQQHRVLTLPCGFEQLLLMSRGEIKDLFPVVLKPELLLRSGFLENKDYPLLPSAREFMRALPVKGTQSHSIMAYVKSNGECFARAMLDKAPMSNPVFHMHQLQNLYYALTGEELPVQA